MVKCRQLIAYFTLSLAVVPIFTFLIVNAISTFSFNNNVSDLATVNSKEHNENQTISKTDTQLQTNPTNTNKLVYNNVTKINETIGSSQQEDDIDEEKISNIISSYLTVISFLTATSSFVLGLYAAGKVTIANPIYYKGLVVAIIIPAIILNIIGMFLVVNLTLNQYYQAVFMMLFIPVAAIFLLLFKS